MKNVRMGIASLMLALCLVVAGNNSANAQRSTIDAGQVLAGLVNVGVVLPVNVNVSDIDVNVVDVVDINDVLNNSLNNNDVRVLTDFLNNNNILNDALNNLLRDADVIKNNQIVVGVVAAVLGSAGQVIEPAQVIVARAAPGRMR